MRDTSFSRGYIVSPLRFVRNKEDEGIVAKLKCCYVSLEQKPIKDVLNELNRRRETMEIGGIDIIFKMSVPVDSGIHYMKNILSRYYPNGIIETDSFRDEFFIYENQKAKDIWDSGEVEDSMIYVIGSENTITLVVNRNPKLITKMVESFHILGCPATIFTKAYGG